MRDKNLQKLNPLVENLRTDLAVIAKDLRIMAIKLRGANMDLMVYKLFTNADTLESYVERLK